MPTNLRIYIIEWRTADGDDVQTLVIETTRDRAWDRFAASHPNRDPDSGSITNVARVPACIDMR